MRPSAREHRSAPARPRSRNTQRRQQWDGSFGSIEVRFGTVFFPHGGVLSLDGASARSRLACQLIDAFRVTPGLPLSRDALAAALWEESVGDAARLRLKVAIYRLRAAGFPILGFGGGYAIDPRTTLVEIGEKGE